MTIIIFNNKSCANVKLRTVKSVLGSSYPKVGNLYIYCIYISNCLDRKITTQHWPRADLVCKLILRMSYVDTLFPSIHCISVWTHHSWIVCQTIRLSSYWEELWCLIINVVWPFQHIFSLSRVLLIDIGRIHNQKICTIHLHNRSFAEKWGLRFSNLSNI